MHVTPKGRRDAEDAVVAEPWRNKYTSGMSFALTIAYLSKQLGKSHPLVCSHRSLLRCGGNAL